MSNDPLLSRIRGEYKEMPGLRLTVAQAARLWGIDSSACQVLLDRLVEERYLLRTRDGAYIALPHPTPVKTVVQNISSRRKPHAS